MDDEIHPVIAVDVSRAANQNCVDALAELELHSGCPSRAGAQYKRDYLAFLDEGRISAMFSNGRSRKMFDWRRVRCDFDIGA